MPKFVVKDSPSVIEDPYLRFAFALDGLIRSRVSGDGGEEFARKCIRELAEALREMKTYVPTTVYPPRV